MTYVELIVVLSIFATMCAISLVSYNGFQARIEIRRLANDIALQVVQAQKDASAGKLANSYFCQDCKPSYGVYFTKNDPYDVNHNHFIYFADLNGNGVYDPGSGCGNLGDECVEEFDITRNNYISDIVPIGDSCPSSIDDAYLVSTRSESGIHLRSSDPNLDNSCSSVQGIRIIASSTEGIRSSVEVYLSGRIQIVSVSTTPPVNPSCNGPLCSSNLGTDMN